MTPKEIYQSEEYQRLSGAEKYRIDCLPSQERLRALNNLHLYNNPEQGVIKGISESEVYNALLKLPLEEQNRINSLPPVARLETLRSLVKK